MASSFCGIFRSASNYNPGNNCGTGVHRPHFLGNSVRERNP